MTRRPFEVVVDGTDGAGKSPCVTAIVAHLTSRGLSVAHHAPYREEEVYPLWAERPQEAATIISSVMARFRTRSRGCDVLVWDRGWPTAFVSTEDHDARALFSMGDITLLLLGSPAQTRKKVAAEGPKGIWVEDDSLVRRFNDAYHSLTAPAGVQVRRFAPSPEGAHFDFGAVVEVVDQAFQTL